MVPLPGRAVGGEARVNDDESIEVAWFDQDDLPALDAAIKLRIDTTLAEEAPAWFASAGARQSTFDRPHRDGRSS